MIKKRLMGGIALLVLGLLLFLEGIFIQFDFTTIGIPSILFFGFHLHHWILGLIFMVFGSAFIATSFISEKIFIKYFVKMILIFVVSVPLYVFAYLLLTMIDLGFIEQDILKSAISASIVVAILIVGREFWNRVIMKKRKRRS